MTDTDVAFMTRPTYKIDVAYAKTVTAIHTEVALLDTGGGVNLIHSAPTAPE